MSTGEASEPERPAAANDPPDVLRSRDEPPAPIDCPRCGLRLTAPVPSLAVQYCPRCLARSRIAVQLSGSDAQE
jgi:hypothetical protein